MTWLLLQIRQAYERNVCWTLVGITIRLDWTHNQLKVVRNTLIRLYKHLEGVSKQCMELVGESWLILPKRGTKHMILIIIFFLFANRTTADKRLHIHPPWRRMNLQAETVPEQYYKYNRREFDRCVPGCFGSWWSCRNCQQWAGPAPYRMSDHKRRCDKWHSLGIRRQSSCTVGCHGSSEKTEMPRCCVSTRRLKMRINILTSLPSLDIYFFIHTFSPI